ncbi:hypothetical protein KIH39_09175 [Telmatocola sphagniphila]|uniref:Uncharacterized protein n=1 Tax=Telmatocola sphagniphila TaxID=1123043 RepID=A0A8E6BA33_9BACT|nr:hypothetical protein [Telmatocola sphagniphila]QVL34059.1 hypothetical protein KIH39_09175 [Telmatocola sphagniphila]
MTLNGLQNVRLSVAISIRNLSETTAKNRRIANEVKRLLEMGVFKKEDIQSNISLGEKRKLIDLELSLCS